MVCSNGAAKQFQGDCLGIYEFIGEYSNEKPIYKHLKRDRYLHWTYSKDARKSWWLVGKVKYKLFQLLI